MKGRKQVTRKASNLMNYTTTIEPIKTAGEIMGILAGKGAKSINMDYTNGEPSGIAFHIVLNGVELSFRLPCNAEGAFKAMCNMKIPNGYKNRIQAKRVAWRNLKAWVESQLAMVEMQQVEMSEVFMPYMVIADTNQTLFQVLKQNPDRLIESVQPERKLLSAGNIVDGELLN